MGLKKNNPGCTCCGGTCACVTVSTDNCDDVSRYSFTIAGVINDECSECDLWNGSFDLCFVGDNTWATSPHSGTQCGHSAGQPLYTLTVDGGYYVLTATSGWNWRIAVANWTCSGVNILSQGPLAGVNCTDWPSTVTLTPCVGCLLCDPSDSMPSSVQVDISGLTNNACNCDVLNGTFVLDRVTQACTRTYYSSTVLVGCPTSMWCPGARELTITATAQTMVGGVGWAVRLTLGRATYSFCGFSTVEYKWVTDETFDCSVEHELEFATTTDSYFCGNWSGASVTLTPL